METQQQLPGPAAAFRIFIDKPGTGIENQNDGNNVLPASSSSSSSSSKPTTMITIDKPLQEQQQQQQKSPQNPPAPAPTPAPAPASRLPPRRFTPDGKVTSVDLSPDGTYVIAGCSDGTIRLYSMVDATWGSEGILLGQIHAKGLITNLIFHVEVADDGRFAFAGVLRGSVEMFAYDLTKLPAGPWEQEEGGRKDHKDGKNDKVKTLSKAEAESLIECHTNLDPKLRGFGAVARVTGAQAQDNPQPPEYRLICGLGIKNLHIWRFQEGVAADAPPLWECIFDLVSNGMSIELLAVRAGGLEAVSKSCGQNLRVWDLSSAEEKDKAPYTDVVNTQDTQAVFGDNAYGGTCHLSLVRLDACRQLNRMELPLPTTASTQNKSKRRQLCSVKDVVGTHGGGAQDGRVLIICSDGGVHCYENTGTTVGKLVPVHSLTVEEDDDVTFQLASVGREKSAVVLQTRWLAGENLGEILVAPLLLGQPKEEAMAIRKALGELNKNNLTAATKGGNNNSGSNSGGKSIKASPSPHNSTGKAAASNAPAGNSQARGNSPPNTENEAPQTQTQAQPKKPTKKRAKSLPTPGNGSLLEATTVAAGKSKDVETGATTAAVAAATAAAATAAAAAAVMTELQLQGPLVLCKPPPVRRAPPLPVAIPAAPSAPPASVAPSEVAPYYPIKRKHYDPFQAMTRPKRGKNTAEAPPKAIREVEAKRLLEDADSKTADFFKERVARQEALRDLRIAMEVKARKARLSSGAREAAVADSSTELCSSDSIKATARLPSSVMKWGQLREKHRGEKDVLVEKFRAEHDWLRNRFLDAVEAERLMFHVNRQALPSSVRDPVGFLWWQNSRLPLKKQWGRYRAFPQQSLDEMALGGLPDVTNRRFSLTGVIANYKDMAARMLRRQQAEADMLASVQGMDLPFAHVQPLKVAYPYAQDWAMQDPAGREVQQQRQDGRKEDEQKKDVQQEAEKKEEKEGTKELEAPSLPAVAAAPTVTA